MQMDCFNFTCQGESHKASNKVCQDYSYSKIYEDGRIIAIVCDGHGGKRYFRSDVGSKIAGEVTEKNVKVFTETIGNSLFLNKPYTSNTAIATQISNEQFEKESDINKAFRQLFASIIYDWNVQIVEHAKNTPLTEIEQSDMEQKWIEDFNSGVSLEKVYGCTLMTYVQTNDYWFAFHIGDGKCISFNSDAKWIEPIPWDDRCFLNKTTSLCDSIAIEEFRYCFQGNGNFPTAIFLGSDGLDDSFGAEENLVNFYVQIIKEIVHSSKEDVFSEVAKTLPQLSKIGSKDDMSLAVVYSKDQLKTSLPNFILWQINQIEKRISIINLKIEENQIKIYNSNTTTNHLKIEYNYAISDFKKLIKERDTLLRHISKLLKELKK